MALQECALNLNNARRELQAQGTPEFPCAGYRSHCRETRAEDEVPWHYHPELEVLCLAAGQMRVQAPGVELVLHAGEGVFFNAGVLHRAAAVGECELHSLVFAPRLLTGGEDSVFARRYLTPLTQLNEAAVCFLGAQTAEDAAWHAQYEAAFAALERDDFGCEFTVRAVLSALCVRLCAQHRDALPGAVAAVPADAARTRRMLDFIHAHCDGPLTLEAIAQAAGVGTRECLRCFARTLQISPVQYALKYRITQSATLLLADPQCSVSAAAQRYGFDSPSRYGQLFRRYFGCTPREYRAAHAAE